MMGMVLDMDITHFMMDTTQIHIILVSIILGDTIIALLFILMVIIMGIMDIVAFHLGMGITDTLTMATITIHIIIMATTRIITNIIGTTTTENEILTLLQIELEKTVELQVVQEEVHIQQTTQELMLAEELQLMALQQMEDLLLRV